MINVKKQFLQGFTTPILCITALCNSMDLPKINCPRLSLSGKILMHHLPNQNLIGYPTTSSCEATNALFGAEILKTTDLCIPVELMIRDITIANPNDTKAYFNWMQLRIPKDFLEHISRTFNFLLTTDHEKLERVNSILKNLQHIILSMFLLPIHMVIGNSKLKIPNVFVLFNVHLTFDQHDLLLQQIHNEHPKTSVDNCKFLIFAQPSNVLRNLLPWYFSEQLPVALIPLIPYIEENLSLLEQEALLHCELLQKANILCSNPSHQKEIESPIKRCFELKNAAFIGYTSNYFIHCKTEGSNRIIDTTIKTLTNSHNRTNLITLLEQRSTGQTNLRPHLLVYPRR